jgi:hypothetical protein
MFSQNIPIRCEKFSKKSVVFFGFEKRDFWKPLSNIVLVFPFFVFVFITFLLLKDIF